MLVLLFTTLYFALKSPKIQTYIAQKVTQGLSEKFGLPITIDHVEIDFFNTVLLDDFYVEDLNKDTLIYFSHLEAKLSYFSLFQSKVSLNQITLDDLYINIERAYEDSLFNIDELKLDSFTKVDSSANNATSSWAIQLHALALNNPRVNFKDFYGGKVLETTTDQILLNFNYMKFGDMNIEMDELSLIHPDILFNSMAPNPNFEPKSGASFSLNLPLQIKNKNFNIVDGQFAFKQGDNITQNSKAKFNHKDLNFSNIELNTTNFLLAQDSIYTAVNRLTFSEKSGLEIIELTNELIVSKRKVELNDLVLRTNNSSVKSDVVLTYNSFDDFSNFFEDVRFDLNMEPSLLHAKDLELFVSNDKVKLKYPIRLEGNIYGSVSSFKSKGLVLSTGKNTVFEGDFSMNGLPNLKGTFISGRVDRLATNYIDLLRIYPTLPLPKNIEKLGNLNFRGNFDGFINDFVTNGYLKTDLGSAYTDLNFKLDQQNNAAYSGSFSLKEFELGKYFGIEETFGTVSLKGKGKGKGLKLNTLDVALDGVIEKIEFKGYAYRNIVIDGQVKDKFFNGNLEIDDDNIVLDFVGEIDASDVIPKYKFDANVQRLDLKALNIWNREYVLSANIKSDFTASNINNLIGDVNLEDLVVSSNDVVYNIGDIQARSRNLVNGEKRFSLDSKDIDAEIQGTFEFAKIPDAFKSVLIPNYSNAVADQLIKFEVNVKDKPELLTLLMPELGILKPSRMDGNLNSNEQSMLAVLNVPIVQYKNFSVFDWTANVFIDHGEFDVINSIPSIYLKDSLLVKDFMFLAKGPSDQLKLKLFANGSGNSTVELIANVISKNERTKLEFEPSNIFINDQFWLIDEKNEIILGERISSRNLKLYNGISELLIDLEIGRKDQRADVFLSNIFLEDFTQFLEAKNIELKGIANGKVSMNIDDSDLGFFGDLMIENIEVNDYKVGNLNTSAVLDLPNKKVNINGNLYGDDNEVDINGSYSFGKQITPKDFDINFDIKNFAIYSVEEFIQQYIDNTDGTVSGQLSLVGPRNKPDLLGYLDINDVTTTVTYLQTTYNVRNQRVTFDKRGINLGDKLRITDSEGNEAFGKGRIYHAHLKDWGLDIEAWSKKIMGLNTTLEDNQDFYGTAFLNGSVTFKGPTNDIAIYITGESEGKTEIAIPLTEDGDASEYQFYTFMEKKVKKEDEFLINRIDKFKVNSLTVNLDLDIDNDCKVKIILDQTTGDILEVKGEGNVKIAVPKEGDVMFYGNYVITDGDYLFTLQSIINKKFRIESGSSISFQGKIEDTKVNVDAIYNLRAAPDNLIRDFLANSVDEQEALEAKNRLPVKLKLALRNNLYNPDIAFDIQIEQLNPKLKNLVDRKIFTLKQYENEMNRQVFGLLVLNQFLPPLSSVDQVTNGGFNINASDAANTVSEFLSNQLTRYFNDWLSYLSDDVSLNFNYRNYEQDISNVTSIEDLALRRELQLALTTKFLNERVTINVGGNVDFGTNQLGIDNANTTYFGGNASIEYALTENRRFRIKAFTNTDYDYFNQGNNTRAGVGLSFRREFDTFKELKIGRDEFKIVKEQKDSLKVE